VDPPDRAQAARRTSARFGVVHGLRRKPWPAVHAQADKRAADGSQRELDRRGRSRRGAARGRVFWRGPSPWRGRLAERRESRGSLWLGKLGAAVRLAGAGTAPPPPRVALP